MSYILVQKGIGQSLPLSITMQLAKFVISSLFCCAIGKLIRDAAAFAMLYLLQPQLATRTSVGKVQTRIVSRIPGYLAGSRGSSIQSLTAVQ